MSRLRRAALLLAGALAVGACGSGGEGDVASGSPLESTATTTVVGTPPRSDTDAADVPDELDFVAPDVRGGQVVGADLAGQDLVIWFWAPW